MAEPFIGQIIMAGFNFAPKGYATCDGQLISIAQNTALFSLLGTTYGGNGQTNFALPDLRGRVPMHFGQGPGLSSYSLGQASGSENVTLLSTQMPAHNHVATLRANSAGGTMNSPNGAVLAASDAGNVYSATDNASMGAGAIQVANTGGSQPHTNMQPYLVVNFSIAMQGIFPSRN